MDNSATGPDRGGYRSIFDCVNDAIFVHDPATGAVIDVNERMLEMYECERSDIVGGDPERFCQSESPYTLQDALYRMKLAAEGQPQLFEWYARTVSGRCFWVEVSMRLTHIGDDDLLVAAVRDIDERKRAQEQLKQSQERLKLILEATKDGVWEADLRTGKHYFSKPIWDMVGTIPPDGEDILAFFRERVHPDDRRRFDQDLAAFMDMDHEQYWSEFRLRSQSGEYRHILSRGRCIERGEGGTPLWMVGTHTDITELKETETALHESELRFRTVADNIPLGIAMVDARLRLITANKAYVNLARKCGHEAREFLLRASDEGDNPVQNALLNNQASQVEHVVRTDAGSHRLQLRAYPLEDHRNARGCILVVEDITERHRAQNERDRFFNMSMDLLCIAGFDGVFRQLSPAWTKALGWSEEELTSRSWLDFVHEDDREATVAAGEQLAAGREVIGFVNRYRCKNGDIRWLSWNSFPVKDEGIIYAAARDVTQERLTERERLESEQRFANIVQSSPMGVYLYELRGDDLVLIDSNQAADRFTGIRNSELIGKTIEEAFPNLANSEIPERYRAAARDGTPYHTTDFFYEDEKIRGAFDVYAFQTSPGRMAVMFMDVTDRIRHEQEIAASEQTHREIFNVAQEGIFIQDLETADILDVNEAVTRIFGYSREEMLELTLDDISYGGEYSLANAGAIIQHAIHDGPQFFEWRCRRKDGEPFWVEVNLKVAEIRGEECLLAVTRDVTERKQRADELRASEENLRITLNSIADAVVTTDADGSVIRLNPVAEELTGWTMKDAAGEAVAEVLQVLEPDTLSPLAHPIQGVLNTGESTTTPGPHILSTRTGDHRFIAHNCSPIRNAQNEIVGAVLVFRDITEEFELQEQLRHIQKMDSIGQLAGGIAHDFNNMLGGILGAAELLSRRLGDHEEKYQRYLHMIVSSAERAADLTQKLLAFSRKGRMKTEAVNICEIIGQVGDILKHTIDRRIRLRFDLPERPLSCMGDPAQIQNAILNLAINARDAMPEGGHITFRCFAEHLDKAFCDRTPFEVFPGEFVGVSVSDSGHGIPPNNLTRIFEPFFTTKGVGKGTGLGLAAVDGTTRDHDGAISVESELGNGTTFTLYLPLVDPATNAAPALGTEEGRREGRILVVDDEEVIRTLAEEMISCVGYDVATAANGKDAIRLYRDQMGAIDLILLDLVMPEMNGQEAFYALKTLNPDVKIIIATGFNLTGSDAGRLISDGAIGFVQKPYHRDRLLQAIGEALG